MSGPCALCLWRAGSGGLEVATADASDDTHQNRDDHHLEAVGRVEFASHESGALYERRDAERPNAKR